MWARGGEAPLVAQRRRQAVRPTPCNVTVYFRLLEAGVHLLPHHGRGVVIFNRQYDAQDDKPRHPTAAGSAARHSGRHFADTSTTLSSSSTTRFSGFLVRRASYLPSGQRMNASGFSNSILPHYPPNPRTPFPSPHVQRISHGLIAPIGTSRQWRWRSGRNDNRGRRRLRTMPLRRGWSLQFQNLSRLGVDAD
jgi:hypothetical protein